MTRGNLAVRREYQMRGLSMALNATVLSGGVSEAAAMRIRSTKGKQDLKTTAKTV